MQRVGPFTQHFAVRIRQPVPLRAEATRARLANRPAVTAPMDTSVSALLGVLTPRQTRDSILPTAPPPASTTQPATATAQALAPLQRRVQRPRVPASEWAVSPPRKHPRTRSQTSTRRSCLVSFPLLLFPLFFRQKVDTLPSNSHEFCFQ